MFRKLFAFILISGIGGALAIAQTPETKKDREKAAQTMVWSFDGDGGYLGVETAEITKDNFGKYGLRDIRGVAVEKVIDGSPAQAAGLQNGDVITRFNGEEITSVRKLTRLLGEVAPDHQVKLTVSRNGDDRELTVTIGKRPAPRFADGAFSMVAPGEFGKFQMPSMPDMPQLPPTAELPQVHVFPSTPGFPGENFAWHFGSSRQIGIGITPLTKQLSDHFGVTNGILINNVRENSPAAKAGLRAGDIITEVDGKALKGEGDLIRAIGEKKEGSVNLTIVRDRNRQTISVTPEKAEGGFNSLIEFPDAPAAAGQFKLLQPGVPAIPATPMPLNQLFIPGRVL